MPKWRVTDADGAELPDEEFNTPLELWAALVNLHRVLRRTKWDEQWGGAAFLRLYIPPILGFLVPGDEASGPLERGSLTDLNDAFRRIQVMAVDALSGGVIRDEHDMVRALYYRYVYLDEDDQERQRVELHCEDEIAHFEWDGSAGAALPEAGSWVEVPELRQVNPFWEAGDFRGLSYMMFPLEREHGSAITPGARDLQDHLNAASTDLRRNGSLAGFPTFIFGNLAALQDQVTNLNLPPSKGGAVSQVGPKSGIKMGPGEVLELVGLEVRDGAGNVIGYATPSAERLEPVNPEGTLREIDHWRGGLLRAFDRLWTETHLLSVSGKSRQESRNGWDLRLLGETESTHEMVRWGLRAGLRLAMWLTGKDLSEDLRVVPTLFVDVKPSNLETYQVLLQGYAQHVVSLETLVNHTPIENLDTDAERARLEVEDAEREARGRAALEAERDAEGDADGDEEEVEEGDEDPGGGGP
jgi:hypothetical protein